MNCCTRVTSAKRIVSVIALLALCLVAGCYERVSQGNTAVYHFVWWLGPAVIAGGILGVPFGWLLRKAVPKWGYALMIVGPLLLIFVAPAMYSDHVVIDDDHFEATYGLWFSPQVQSLQFKDLSQIQYVGIPDNRGRTKYEMHCLTRTGQMTVVPAGDLVRQTVPELLARAKAKGVAVLDLAQ